MDLAITVTPPLSKRSSPAKVLYHATNAAPLGPRSDSQDKPLVIKFLHNFFTSPHLLVTRAQNLSMRMVPQAALMTCLSASAGAM